MGFDFDCKKMDNHVLSYDDIFRGECQFVRVAQKVEKAKNEGVWL